MNGNIIKITDHTVEKQRSNIKIVDISLNEDGEFIVDIKLRNIGEEVAFIKEISFDVLDYYNMLNPQMTQYQLVKSSNIYDVVLGEERRQVSIAEPRMVTIYYLSLSIIYDEDNKAARSEKYLWAVPSIGKYAGYYISHTDMEIAKKNYLELKKMDRYDAIKSKHFINIFKSYEDNKPDFLD